MTIFVMLTVLAAALMHASWNALIKSGGDKVQGMLALTIGHAVVGAVMVAFVGPPPVQAWGWLAASVLIHAFYQTFLALAFTHGDLSRVYPISRGTATQSCRRSKTAPEGSSPCVRGRCTRR